MLLKLKTQKGSAMSLVLVLIVLVSIVGSSITMMVNNQIKVSAGNLKNTDLKYNVETGIEEVIGKFIEEISVKGENYKFSEVKMLANYINLADILVASNGNLNRDIYIILNNLEDGSVTQTDIKKLIDELIDLKENNKGFSNGDPKELLTIAEEYAIFFRDNFFVGESLSLSNMNILKAKNFISLVINNLSLREFIVDNGKHKGDISYGNVGIAHRDLVTVSKNGQIFNNTIYNEFKSDNNTTNITSEIKKLKDLTTTEDIIKWAKEKVGSKLKIDYIIDKIKSTNYIENINKEISNIKNGSYLKDKEIRDYYNKTGNVNFIDFETMRLEVIKQEIDMLLQWLDMIKGIEQDKIIGGGSTSGEVLKVSIPMQVILKDETDEVKKTISITHNVKTPDLLEEPDIIATENINLNKYEFEVLKPSLKTNVVINLKIKSKVDDYTIESDVDVKIYSIVSKDNYKVEYKVKSWDKKID